MKWPTLITLSRIPNLNYAILAVLALYCRFGLNTVFLIELSEYLCKVNKFEFWAIIKTCYICYGLCKKCLANLNVFGGLVSTSVTKL